MVNIDGFEILFSKHAFIVQYLKLAGNYKARMDKKYGCNSK